MHVVERLTVFAIRRHRHLPVRHCLDACCCFVHHWKGIERIENRPYACMHFGKKERVKLFRNRKLKEGWFKFYWMDASFYMQFHSIWITSTHRHRHGTIIMKRINRTKWCIYMISCIEIEINRNEISTLSLFVDLMEKTWFFFFYSFKSYDDTLSVCCVIAMLLLLLLLPLFTYESWMGFMQINTANDGQLCLISDFICTTIEQSKRIGCASRIVWVPFTFVIIEREHWKRSKTIDCYLSKRFIIDMVCVYTYRHVGPGLSDWFGKMSITRKGDFLVHSIRNLVREQMSPNTFFL